MCATVPHLVPTWCGPKLYPWDPRAWRGQGRQVVRRSAGSRQHAIVPGVPPPLGPCGLSQSSPPAIACRRPVYVSRGIPGFWWVSTGVSFRSTRCQLSAGRVAICLPGCTRHGVGWGGCVRGGVYSSLLQTVGMGGTSGCYIGCRQLTVLSARAAKQFPLTGLHH